MLGFGRGSSWLLVALVAAGGCYHGARAARDVNQAWQGRSRAEIEARWGKPAQAVPNGAMTALVWTHTRRRIELPSGTARLTLEPGNVELYGEVRPGAVWNSITEVMAEVDPRGTVVRVTGPSLRWGAPADANLRWGTLLGLHVGMGRLDDTETPLPSGGLYIGGMLSPTVGLVGCYSMVSGTGDRGGAMGFAWGMGVKWWADARTSVRAGPAMVLAFDAGFEDPTLQPAVNGVISYALVRAGTFVLDLRLDVTAGSSDTFGNLGVGVNLN